MEASITSFFTPWELALVKIALLEFIEGNKEYQPGGDKLLRKMSDELT